MSDRPLVSVIITYYNRDVFLRRALASVFGQTYPNIEIIVIDDCSQIDPRLMIGDMIDRLTYVRLDTNSGANVARNIGIGLAKGEYISFLDDDDFYFPHKIERQVNLIGSSIACLCGYISDKTMSAFIKKAKVVDQDFLRRGNACGMTGFLCRADWLKENRFDEKLGNSQDWDIFVRISQSDALRYVDEPLYLYRSDGSDSITTAVKRLDAKTIERRLGAAYKHREWLGEYYFNRRAASQIMAFIGTRRDAMSILMTAVKIVGIKGVMLHFYYKMLGRMS